MSNMQIRPKSGMGRPLSEEQSKARKGIIEAFEKRSSWSTDELAIKCEVESDAVLRAMRFFQKQGYVKRNGTKRSSGRPGYPPIMWKKVDNP